MRSPVVGVMGGHEADAAAMEAARRLGAAVAAEGWAVLTGGRDEGVMRAATQGARDAGGLTIAVHPGLPGEPAADADVVIRTGIGFARNVINVLSSDVIIALPGAAGTLSELAYATTHGVPAVLFGFDDHGLFEDVQRVDSVEAAIVAIRRHLDA